MKYAVISHIYNDWRGQYEITEWKEEGDAPPFEELPDCDRYIDLFDSYDEAKAFYDECMEEEGA